MSKPNIKPQTYILQWEVNKQNRPPSGTTVLTPPKNLSEESTVVKSIAPQPTQQHTTRHTQRKKKRNQQTRKKTQAKNVSPSESVKKAATEYNPDLKGRQPIQNFNSFSESRSTPRMHRLNRREKELVRLRQEQHNSFLDAKYRYQETSSARPLSQWFKKWMGDPKVDIGQFTTDNREAIEWVKERINWDIEEGEILTRECTYPVQFGGGEEGVTPITLFEFTHKRLPSMESASDVDILVGYARELRAIPRPCRRVRGTVLGFIQFLEHEYSPFEDDEFLLYSSSLYPEEDEEWGVPKSCLSFGRQTLVSNEVFKQWLDEQQSLEQQKQKENEQTALKHTERMNILKHQMENGYIKVENEFYK